MTVGSRLAPLAALAATLGLAAPAGAAPPAGWKPDVRAASAYADAQPGAVAFHVRTEAGHWGRDADRPVAAASVLKAMLLVAYLREPGVRERALRDADRALLDPMVRRSDNVTATRVRDRVGDDALLRLARAAGMRRFVPHPVWGLSRITAREQTRLWLRLEAFLPDRHEAYALALLRTVIPRQRWGVGRVTLPPGWELYFKGGWGSGTGLVDHQVALLRRGDERVAIAVLITGSPSHAAGKRTLRGIFTRLLARLP